MSTKKETAVRAGQPAIAVDETSSLLDALGAIESGGVAAVVVLDRTGRVVGVLTDGDTRRALLAGAKLVDPIAPYVSRRFVLAQQSDARPAVLDAMLQRGVGIIPIVDDEMHLVGVHTLAQLVGRRHVEVPALVLAGGRGTRLEHLTESTPKPMLRVAGRPVLARIIDQLVGCGFRDICLSVAYRADVISSYFGSGDGFGCRITYLREDPESPRGTGGPLVDFVRARGMSGSNAPVVVVNGDTLDGTDFAEMLSFHQRMRLDATVLCSDFTFKIPYGVLHVEGDLVVHFEEKPVRHERVNAGAYVINANLVSSLDHEGLIAMTYILSATVTAAGRVGAFSGTSDWVDIGTPQDLARARSGSPTLS